MHITLPVSEENGQREREREILSPNPFAASFITGN